MTEITSGEDERDECKRTAEDASKSNRDDTKTGIARLVREERDRNLLFSRRFFEAEKEKTTLAK